jgi:hypothetical protein
MTEERRVYRVTIEYSQLVFAKDLPEAKWAAEMMAAAKKAVAQPRVEAEARVKNIVPLSNSVA